MQVPQAFKCLEPYETLWSMATEFHRSYNRWNTGVVFNLDAEAVEGDVLRMWRVANKLAKGLSEIAQPAAACATSIKKKLDDFKAHLPLLFGICNKGLRERHWKKMSEVVGFPLSDKEPQSLSRLLELGTEDHVEELETISDMEVFFRGSGSDLIQSQLHNDAECVSL